MLARNGQKYQPPGKEGKAPFKGGKGRAKVNATEQETTVKEATPMETELNARLATMQARLDSILPDPAMACIRPWYPATGLEQDPHANVVIVTPPEEENQPQLTYAAAAKTALEPAEGQRSHASQRTPACQTLKAKRTSIREKLIPSQNCTIWQGKSKDQKDGNHSYEIPTQSDDEEWLLTDPEDEEEEGSPGLTESEDEEEEDPPGLHPPGCTHHSEDKSSNDEDEEEQYATAVAAFSYNLLKARTQRILNRGRNGTLQYHAWDPKKQLVANLQQRQAPCKTGYYNQRAQGILHRKADPNTTRIQQHEHGQHKGGTRLRGSRSQSRSSPGSLWTTWA